MKHLFLAAIAIVVVLTGAHPNAQSGYDLFQKALATERADGNLREAIQMYERVVKQFASDRALVARALIRIADCQEKLGQRDAAKVYERIVREFADQAESVGVARARLTALQSPIPQAVQAVRKIWSGAEVDPMGSPSADGRFLSYTNWTTGDLAIRDIAEGTSRMVTNTGGWETSGDYAELSVLSPDARQIAYAWFVDKDGDPKAKCTCRYQLRVMPLSGPDAGKPRILLRGDSSNFWVQPAAWTPDGKGLLFLRTMPANTHEIAILTFADNTVRVLKTGTGLPPSRISLSPDGRMVALDIDPSPDATGRDIVMVPVDGGADIPAVQDPAHDYAPTFTYDGSQLMFLSDRTGTNSLWRQPLANGRPSGPAMLVAPASPGASLLGMTRNGTAYYWAGGANSNVYGVDLDATLTAKGTPRIGVERFLNTNNAPSFSPDGAHLAYVSRRGSGPGQGASVLVIRNLATNQDRDMPGNLAQGSAVSWFPDGRSLLFATRDAEGNRLHYHRLDLATGEHRRVMSTKAFSLPGARPQVSSDGKTIVFSDRTYADPNTSVLARFDLASGETTTVKALIGDQYFTSFAVSPDGAAIAYIRDDGPTRWSITEVVAVNGGEARELFREKNTGPARFSGLAWSRDQGHVLIARDNNLAQRYTPTGGSFWKIPLAGGPPQPTEIAMPGMVRFPSIDPTGTRLMFAAAGGGEPAIWAVENFLPRK